MRLRSAPTSCPHSLSTAARWGTAALVALALMAFAQPARAQQMAFQKARTLTVAQMQRLASPLVVRVRIPMDGSVRRFRVFRFKPLLRAVYGSRFRPGQDILFTCADRYQPIVPGDFLVRHEAYLAFASADSRPFRMVDHGKNLALGPFFLVWDTLRDPAATHVAADVWPYQVVAAAPVWTRDRLAALAPPGGSATAVERGFVAFTRYCTACHSINGEGGQVGPELNYPVNVTEYYRPERLLTWIDNPAAVRWRTSMPPLAAAAPMRARTIRDIVAYLQAMRHHKIRPQK